MSSTDALFERFYYSRPGYIGGTTVFHRFCQQRIPAGSTILEVGAGPTNSTSALLSSMGPTTGVDISTEVFGNKHLTDAKVYDGRRLPFADGSFDACVSDFVLEHVEYPQEHFAEIGRVLKPGGVYCLRTPNLCHYVTIGSRMLPHRYHLKFANQMRGRGSEAHDPYPTFYRANTVSSIRRLCGGGPLQVATVQMMEKEPSYGAGSPALFFPMMAYERMVNGVPGLSNFRVTIIAALTKGSPLDKSGNNGAKA